MADRQWQKVGEIFNAARRQPLELRQNYLNQACGENKSLLNEVESLLSSHDSSESFLETPAIAEVAETIGNNHQKLKNGNRFGNYEIIQQIGTGGMGEVYLAEDKKLDRQVAIKVLKENFSKHEANLKRFIREAKSASALNHPNILVIHEIGETDKKHYLVSEYVKGETLREVSLKKSLKLAEILDYSIQVANALAAAHEVRLIHRDIKPENIMIRPDGLVKVLDFGLAKLVEQKNKSILGLDDEETNQTAKGVILGTVNYMSPEQAKGERVDERTDIFSLGVVIYEMLAGQTPFAAESALETLANLINSEPIPLNNFVVNVPDKLQKIVSKMLFKNAKNRYQTMKDLLADFKELQEKLTFEENLERRGNVSLADWKKAGQNEVGNLQTPTNAYQAYQLARYYFQKLSFPDTLKSREWLEEAVRLDADFAPAYAALAEQLVMEAVMGLQVPTECLPKAKTAIQRAASLNLSSAEFYAAAGFVDLVCDWNFAEAKRNLKKALKLNPYYALANHYLGLTLTFQCQSDKAEFYLRRAVEIEPMNFYHSTSLAISCFLGRNYQKVFEECEKILHLFPGFAAAAWMRGWAFEQTDKATEAVIEYEKILREPQGELARRWIGYAYALIGDRENAFATAAKLEAESREHYISPTHLAILYSGLNEADKAFFYLENALEIRDPWILWTAADPRFDNLRSDRRFDDLIKRIGLK